MFTSDYCEEKIREHYNDVYEFTIEGDQLVKCWVTNWILVFSTILVSLVLGVIVDSSVNQHSSWIIALVFSIIAWILSSCLEIRSMVQTKKLRDQAVQVYQKHFNEFRMEKSLHDIHKHLSWAYVLSWMSMIPVVGVLIMFLNAMLIKVMFWVENSGLANLLVMTISDRLNLLKGEFFDDI